MMSCSTFTEFAWAKLGRNAGNRPIKGLGWEPSSHYLGDSDHLAGKLLLLVQFGIDQVTDVSTMVFFDSLIVYFFH